MPGYTHNALVIKALEYLFVELKYPYVCAELKFGRYIYDVVGSDGKNVVIIEAKANKKDFMKDTYKKEDIKENLTKSRLILEEDCDIEHYQKNIVKEQKKSIKFNDDNILKLSTRRYIIAPGYEKIDQNVPDNWGFIDHELSILKECDYNIIHQKIVEKVIKEICRKNSKEYLNKIGVKFGIFGRDVVFPEVFFKTPI